METKKELLTRLQQIISEHLGVQQNVTAFILAMNLRARAMSRLDDKPFEELVEARA